MFIIFRSSAKIFTSSYRNAAVALSWLGIAVGAQAQDLPPAFPCVIKPALVSDVSVRVPGVVDEVLVGRGERVSKGQVLARLEDRMERAELRLAERKAEDRSQIDAIDQRLAVAETQEDRMRALRERQLLTAERTEQAASDVLTLRQERRQAEARLEIAALELDRAQAALDLRRVESPIDGIIADRAIDPGEFGAEAEPIFRVVALDPLRVEVFLPTALYDGLAAGDPATVTPEAPFDVPLTATLRSVDPVFEAVSGTVFVTYDLPNPDGQIPAGMSCEIAPS